MLTVEGLLQLVTIKKLINRVHKKMLKVKGLLQLVIIKALINKVYSWPYKKSYMLYWIGTFWKSNKLWRIIYEWKEKYGQLFLLGINQIIIINSI